MINILIVAVLGGMRHPVGPFIGAVVFVLLQNFAIDLIDRERFNLVIGLVFLVIVLFSPDGLLGWWDRLRDWARRRMSDAGANVRGRGVRGVREWRSIGVTQARPAGRP
jgi:branched-chain amino acid transport system permease protein